MFKPTIPVFNFSPPRPSPDHLPNNTFVHVYIPLLTQYYRRGSKVGSGGPRHLSNFQNMYHGKQNYKILGIIRGVFVYVYIKIFSGSLSSLIIIYLKFIMISFSNPNVQHVLFSS